MYRFIGDIDALDRIREQESDKRHCSWLKRCPTACDSLPDGVDGEIDGKSVQPGMVCPHNVYSHKHAVFENRDGVSDTLERIFRLIGSSEVGVLSELQLDPLSVTELITAKAELNRQQNEKTRREHERAKLESQVNQRVDLPSWK